MKEEVISTSLDDDISVKKIEDKALNIGRVDGFYHLCWKKDSRPILNHARNPESENRLMRLLSTCVPVWRPAEPRSRGAIYRWLLSQLQPAYRFSRNSTSKSKSSSLSSQKRICRAVDSIARVSEYWSIALDDWRGTSANMEQGYRLWYWLVC